MECPEGKLKPFSIIKLISMGLSLLIILLTIKLLAKTLIKLNKGAGFIVVFMGNVITLPGLNKNSNYLKMHIDDNGNIKELM